MTDGAGDAKGTRQDLALVGRDALVSELVAAARAAARGAGSVVLLTGEAGIGKTSVARLVATAARDDLVVSWGTCAADGGAPPFWPWRELLPATTARGVGGAVPPDSAIGAQRFEVLSRLRDRLFERARHRPSLHIIEDLQWADVASVLLLAHVAAAVSDTPLMVLGSVRTDEPLAHQMQDAIEEVRRLAAGHEVTHLTDGEVAVLMRRSDIPDEPELVRLIHGRTGGNPLFVTEVLRLVRTGRADRLRDVVAGSVPDRVSELLRRRLARLPEPVADVVVAASVIGTEGDVRTLATVAAQSPEAVVDLLEQGRAARVLDAAPAGRWRFRHDLIRDAVYASVTDAARARLHADALEALAATGAAPPPVLAHHALAAQPFLDAERAVALASRAGESAYAQHAYEEAVGWFTQALDAASPDLALRWRAELLVLCGEAHRHIGDIAEARRAFSAAAGLTGAPDLLARAALGYADPGADLGIAYRTEDETTATLLTRAIEAQPDGDSVSRVLLEARLAAELYFSDQPELARRLARSAVDGAARLGDPLALGAAWSVMHDAFVVGQVDLDEQLRGSARLLAWAEASSSAAARLTAHRARVFDLLAAGDLPEVEAEILAFRRVAEPLRAPGYLWWLSLWSAMRALLDGRHEEAEARALEACELGTGPFPVLAFVNLSFLLFFLRREQGRLAELEQATRDYASSHTDVPAIRAALAFLLAETGRADEARGVLAGISADLDRLHDRNWPAAWFQLARAATVVGDQRLAAALLDPRHRPSERCITVSLATACLGSADLAVAWLLHATGDLDAADAHYTIAEEVNARIGAQSWLAQARADHARLLRDRDAPGDLQVAAELITLATDAASRIGLRSIEPVLADLHTLVDGPMPSRAVASPARATFRRSGPVWDLEFAGRAVQVPHARGLSDVAFLLVRPGEAVSVLELLDERGTTAPVARGAPAFDERARRQIRQRLQDLDAEVEEAEANNDGERAAAARAERQLLAEAVARDLGLGGRPRLVGDAVERARKTVSTRIRRTIATVGRHHPELGRHLERSIDTGAWCAYRPAEPVTWTT